MNKNIAELLNEIFVETGWSQPRLAVEVGTSQPTINRILNGQVNCRASTYLAIVKVHAVVVADATKRAKRRAAKGMA